MKINELIAEQQDIEEGIGSFLGKAAGNVAGGLGAAWKDAKQGYKAAKSSWDDPTGANSNDATTGGETTPVGGPNPADLRKQAAELTKQADQIEKAASQPAPAPTTPAPTTPPPAPTTATEPAVQEPAQWPAGLPKFNSVTGQKFASPEEAEQVTNSPEFKQQAADIAAGKDPSAPQQPAPTTPPATTPPPAPTTPAPTTPAPTTPAPTTTTPPPADGKMTAAQQAALKAKLQGQRQAGKTTASQTGSGFKDYVGGSQNKLVTNPDGSTSMQKLQREGVEFRSNFLGMII